jgi:hypothetical protein
MGKRSAKESREAPASPSRRHMLRSSGLALGATMPAMLGVAACGAPGPGTDWEQTAGGSCGR